MFGGGTDYVEEEDGAFTFGGHALEYADIPPPQEDKEKLETTEEFKRRVTEELAEGFKLFDINGDGKIDLNELVSIMKSVGKDIDIEDAQEILEEIDKDGDGAIGFEEFTEVMYETMLTGTLDEDLQEVFDVFDENNDGFISATEIQKVFEKLGTLITVDEAQDIILDADEKVDGLIDFDEFKWYYGKIDPLYFKKFQPKPPLEAIDTSKIAMALAAFQSKNTEKNPEAGISLNIPDIEQTHSVPEM